MFQLENLQADMNVFLGAGFSQGPLSLIITRRTALLSINILFFKNEKSQWEYRAPHIVVSAGDKANVVILGGGGPLW